jgi:hypothetical protein
MNYFIMSISEQLKDRIRQTLVKYHSRLDSPVLHDERDFVSRTVAFFRHVSVAHGRESFTTNARSIDKSPIVEFLHSTCWNNPARREIGDLLLVSKLKRGNQVITRRAVIVQSKFTQISQRIWNVDTAQFYLVSNWPTFRRIRPEPQKQYSLEPQSLVWGSYVLVGPRVLENPVYFTSPRILEENPSIFSFKNFRLNLRRLNGFDTSPSFLMRHILCLIGENLCTNPNIDSFVDEMYRIVGIKPDPPNEFYWDSIDDKSESTGFGVVEFSISMPENE